MKALNSLVQIQNYLETIYGAHTGLDVRDFVRSIHGLDSLGELLIQEQEEHVDLALLLDRDIFAAWESQKLDRFSPRQISVTFEELSHFVYYCYNHNRNRKITHLEMETQSEIDRIVLAYTLPTPLRDSLKMRLLDELLESKYSQETYEEARGIAARFIKQLSGGDPRSWTPREFEKLRLFFHSDLAEKIHLSRG